MGTSIRRCIGLTAACLLLIGCVADDYRRQGDAANLSRQHDEAVRNYQAALAADPSMAARPEFVDKMKQARIGAAFDRGQTLAAQGAWERAIEPYLEALALDPQFTPAQEALETARRNAAADLHQRALQQADAGSLDAAIELLRRAVAIDPNNHQAQDALRSTVEQKDRQQGDASELFNQAAALAGRKQWGAACDRLERALKLNPNNLQARTLLHDAHQQLQLSQAALGEAGQFMEEKRLDEAIAASRQALAVWPGNADAEAILRDAEARRERIVELLAQSERERAVLRWEQAMGALYDAREISPHHPGLLALLDQTARDAVADLAGRGRGHLERDELAEADSFFRTAMNFLPSDPAVHTGLAAVAQRRGQLAEQQGHFVAAMIWHQAAFGYHADQRHALDADASRNQLIERARANVRLQAASGDETPTLVAAVRSAAQGSLPAHVHLVADEEEHDHAHYTADISLVSLSVSQELLASRQQQFGYTAYETVPNPEIPRLHAELDSAIAEADSLRARVDIFCDVCHGSGHIHCGLCHGSRFITCDSCSGTRIIIVADKRRKCDDCHQGHIRQSCGPCSGSGRCDDDRCSTCGGAGFVNIDCSACSGSGFIVIVGGRHSCGHCDGRGSIFCGSCGGGGFLTCGHCGGAGRYSTVSIADLRNAEDRVEHLRRELRNAPDTVQQPYTAYWPYTLHEHRKTGSLRASLALRTAAGGTVLDQQSLDRNAAHDDRTIDNANPGIGLNEDGLSLPSDDAVRQQLLADAARDAAGRIIATAAAARRETLLGEARKLEGKDAPDQALESRIAAALIARATDPAAAEQELDAAKRQLVARATVSTQR